MHDRIVMYLGRKKLEKKSKCTIIYSSRNLFFLILRKPSAYRKLLRSKGKLSNYQEKESGKRACGQLIQNGIKNKREQHENDTTKVRK